MYLPCLLPLFKFLKALLQNLGIIFAGDGQIIRQCLSFFLDIMPYAGYSRQLRCRAVQVGLC